MIPKSSAIISISFQASIRQMSDRDRPIIGQGAFGILTDLCSEDHFSLHPFDGYCRGKRYLVKQGIDLMLIDGATAVREMEMLLLLKHPRIVPLHAICFRDQPKPSTRKIGYDSLGLVFPAAIDDLCGATDWKAPEIALDLLADVLLGLEHIHRSGFIHGDLKPNNILLFREDGDLVAKICDLGSCQEIADGPNVTNITTLQYAAPEQFDRTDYGPEIDIWSFGCLVCYFITGRHPIRPATDRDCLGNWAQIRHAAELLPTCPTDQELLHLINTARTQVDPDEIQEAIADWRSHRPQSRSGWLARFEQIDRETLSSTRTQFVKSSHNSVLFAMQLSDEPGELEQLLDGALAFDPTNRLTATQLLDLPIFRAQADRIQSIRKQTMPVSRAPTSDLEQLIPAMQDLQARFPDDAMESVVTWACDNIKMQYRILPSYLDIFLTGAYLMDAWIAEQGRPVDINAYQLLLLTSMILGCKYHCALDRMPICFQNVVDREQQTKKLRRRYLALEREMIISLAGSIALGRRSTHRVKSPKGSDLIEQLQAYGTI